MKEPIKITVDREDLELLLFAAEEPEKCAQGEKAIPEYQLMRDALTMIRSELVEMLRTP